MRRQLQSLMHEDQGQEQTAGKQDDVRGVKSFGKFDRCHRRLQCLETVAIARPRGRACVLEVERSEPARGRGTPAPVFGRYRRDAQKVGISGKGQRRAPSPAASRPPLPPLHGGEEQRYFVTLVSMACLRSESSSQPDGQSFCSEASCSLALAMSPVST
ncbi:MAG: hypothetical protein EOR60_22080 [Mesorhizobium sp.]|nr:MAG: hypothetical protein EOR60_22080 [Mesorhizobium sp.]